MPGQVRPGSGPIYQGKGRRQVETLQRFGRYQELGVDTRKWQGKAVSFTFGKAPAPLSTRQISRKAGA